MPSTIYDIKHFKLVMTFVLPKFSPARILHYMVLSACTVQHMYSCYIIAVIYGQVPHFLLVKISCLIFKTHVV